MQHWVTAMRSLVAATEHLRRATTRPSAAADRSPFSFDPVSRDAFLQQCMKQLGLSGQLEPQAPLPGSVSDAAQARPAAQDPATGAERTGSNSSAAPLGVSDEAAVPGGAGPPAPSAASGTAAAAAPTAAAAAGELQAWTRELRTWELAAMLEQTAADKCYFSRLLRDHVRGTAVDLFQ
jgi:hypothetical protein